MNERRLKRMAQAHAALNLLIGGGHEASEALETAREELRAELVKNHALELGVNYGGTGDKTVLN